MLARGSATRTVGGALALVVAATVWCSLQVAGPAAAQLSPPVSPVEGSDSDAVVARVGERTISVADLEASLAARSGGMRRRSPSLGQQRAALERRIDLLLLREVTEELGIPADPSYLAESNAIRAEAEEKLARLQRKLLLERLASDVEISEAELKARLQETPRRFQTRRVHLRRLVVADEAAAQAAAQRIAEGESFADVAAEVSTDAALRTARGDLGPQDLSALPPRLASSARSLETEGQVSRPFRAQGQWNLIQLVSNARDVPRAFEDVRQPLEQELRAVKAAELLVQLLAARREALGVSIDEDRLEAMAPPPRPERSSERNPRH